MRAKITTAQGLEPEELEDIKDGLSKHSLSGVQHTCMCSCGTILHVSLLMQFSFLMPCCRGITETRREAAGRTDGEWIV